MNHYEKPPLGAKPATLHAEQRAKELADAISRNILYNGFEECSIWVEELKVQIDLARTFYHSFVRSVESQKIDEDGDEVFADMGSIKVEDGLYIKIYDNDEPFVKAEKLYQICVPSESKSVVEHLKEFFPLEDRPTGKWLKRQTIGNVDFAYCSICNEPIIHKHTARLWSFCPNCGANMRGEEE